MSSLKAFATALSARKLHIVVKSGVSRFLQEQPSKTEEAAPQGGDVTFLYRSGKNQQLFVFHNQNPIEGCLVD